MTRRESCLGAFLALTFLLAQPGHAQDRVNPNAQLIVEFQKRLEAYVDLRDKAKKDAPRARETADPAQIRAAQEGLAKNIRAARKDAKAGDIFTPDIRKLFRQLMYPELKGPDAPETKETIKEDAPPPAKVPLRVNATYPEDQPLSTVPANILAAVPKLPDGLEYRVVGRTLILRDAEAGIIVDFIPNAIR